MFCSCFVLSLDACIVTISWPLLFLVMALWVIYWLCRLLKLLVARVIYRCWCVFLYFIGRWGNIWLYSETWCLSLNSSLKLHAFHRSVVLVGATILLGLCNAPHRGRGKLAKPGLLYPRVWIPCCDTVSEKPGSQSRVRSIASDLESWVTCCDRLD
jgi:hypothetical protein